MRGELIITELGLNHHLFNGIPAKIAVKALEKRMQGAEGHGRGSGWEWDLDAGQKV